MSSRVRLRAITIAVIALVACREQQPAERVLAGGGLVSIHDGCAWTPGQIAGDVRRTLTR